MNKLFQTIENEVEQPIEGTVIGEIPDWVSGSLFRNGPGMYEVGKDKFNHLFDPLAMIQKFQIANKKVTYQCRYLRGDNYKRNMAAQRIVVYGFGTLPMPDPCKNIFNRYFSYFHLEETDNTLVSLFPAGGDMYATTERKLMNRIDTQTLEPLEQIDLSKQVSGLDSATAHPHYDSNGTFHNVGYQYKGKRGPAICLVKIPPKSDPDQPLPTGRIVSSLNCDGKMSLNYLHSFAVTEHFYVYIEQPLFMNLFKAATFLLRQEPVNKSITFYPDLNARFRIVSKETGKEFLPKIRYETSALFLFHHINAYEEDDQIILDVCGYKNDDLLQYFYMKNLSSDQCEAGWRAIEDPEPRRYVLPLNIKRKPMGNNLVTIPSRATAVLRENNVVFCTWEKLAETGFELPQIYYSRYNGRKYRYAYGMGMHNAGDCFHTVVKIDTEKKSFVEWKEEKCYPSEPVFVPNPDGISEDDGVILAAVNSSDFEDGKKAFLLVLDAKTMRELARAEFNVPRFPRDFHGLFMTQK